MQLLNDIITYVRRIVKTPSNASLSNELIIDYINRFWINDVDARIQLFDLKKKYQFQTTPAVDQYNMPLYEVQSETPGVPGSDDIGFYPVYQGFVSPAYINGVQVFLETQKNQFFNNWQNIVQYNQAVAVGDGTEREFSFTLPILSPNPPAPSPPLNGILRGHIDITGIIALDNNVDPPVVDTAAAALSIPAVPTTSVDSKVFITSIDNTGANIVVTDSGQFLEGNVNYGLLMVPGKAPYGNSVLGAYGTTTNTINYLTGEVNVTFPTPPADQANINLQCFYFQTGLPRGILFYNNCLTLRSPPSQQFLVELDGYLSPAAFFNMEAAIPFGYMSEYIARGAARKILSDTGDVEQFNFYEPLFKEQEMLVWKRSQRQWTNNRTQTIYSSGNGNFGSGMNNMGAGSI